jgi:hypothetical protein
MKNKSIVFLVSLMVLLGSCKNTLNPLAPYKSEMVVYGLLDQNDPGNVHYIRVNRSFEGNGNAYTMASNYDSVNYPVGSISVVLQQQDPSSGLVVNTYTFDTTSAIPLSPGIFSYPHQVLYQQNITLSAENPNGIPYNYNLTITNNATKQVVTGSTTLLPDLTFSGSAASFATDQNFPLSFNATSPTTVQWNTAAGVRIYQMSIIFAYMETSNTGSVRDSITWVFPTQTAPNLTGGIPLYYSYTSTTFYQFVKANIPVKPDVTRTVVYARFIFTSGSDDLNTYIQLSQPSLGIDQDIPNFTDLKNAVGLFTSRHSQSFTKQFVGSALDSLITDEITSDLNFQP